MSTLPGPAGFRMPAEWQPHEAVWVAWPWDAALWEDALGDAQAEWLAMCRAIASVREGATPERLEILVPTAAHAAQVVDLHGVDLRTHVVPYGDIWMRDIAPLFVRDDAGRVGSVTCAFNGWGGKYVLDGDADVARAVQALDGRRAFRTDLVLEGGSVDVDGEGTCLTTRQCLLHPNRNGAVTEADMEARLRDVLGVQRVLWLDDGLANDHTDGHVDTLARFVAPGVVVCMAPSGDDDPNAAVLDAIARDLGRMRDAQDRPLHVVRIPSPGRVVDPDGELLPASHVNFLIANHAVVVPTYGTPWDDAAVQALKPLFPDRRVVGCSARAILLGGGAFHCITQQVPSEVP